MLAEVRVLAHALLKERSEASDRVAVVWVAGSRDRLGEHVGLVTAHVRETVDGPFSGHVTAKFPVTISGGGLYDLAVSDACQESQSTPRDAVLAELAGHVLAVGRPHPVRVAVDGCSAAGKTTLADELAVVLDARTARPVERVQIDFFKKAVCLRTAFPPDSPESHYLDSWDITAIRDELLVPLGLGGDRRYRTAVMDLPARTPIDGPVRVAADDMILIADGCFLQRPEVDPYWDLRIWVDIGFDEVLRRGVARDQVWMGSAALAEARYRSKYIPGERRYVNEVQPARRAELVVDNREPGAPRLTVRP